MDWWHKVRYENFLATQLSFISHFASPVHSSFVSASVVLWLVSSKIKNWPNTILGYGGILWKLFDMSQKLMYRSICGCCVLLNFSKSKFMNTMKNNDLQRFFLSFLSCQDLIRMLSECYRNVVGELSVSCQPTCQDVVSVVSYQKLYSNMIPHILCRYFNDMWYGFI